MKLPPNKTKIVATIGPASKTPEVLEHMIRAGMNVARLNFSHGEFAEHQQNIENIRSAAKAVGHRQITAPRAHSNTQDQLILRWPKAR